MNQAECIADIGSVFKNSSGPAGSQSRTVEAALKETEDKKSGARAAPKTNLVTIQDSSSASPSTKVIFIPNEVEKCNTVVRESRPGLPAAKLRNPQKA